ncbi:hypothetical protein H3V53_03465 [Paraburkholderia bengalensis]|uniref:Lipoprotein n=1 Tax=Paraburkholderia bengalensis TaxID=2747562 RepID=A0ABU8IL30_9BURK
MNKALTRSLVLAIVVLCACSSVPPAAPIDGSSIHTVRTALDARAKEYQAGSQTWGNKEFWGNNAPLILLGTGSVAVASFASGAAKANWIIGLALAAGVWALTYSTLAPETKQDAYSEAATQLSCLSLSSAKVDEELNPGLSKQRNQLAAAIDLLTDRLADAQAKRSQLPAALSSADQLQVFRADALISRAAETLVSANTELSSAGAILPTLKGLFYAIDRKAQLAARGKVLTNGDVHSALAGAVGSATGSSGTENTKGGGVINATQGATGTKSAPPKSGPVAEYLQSSDAATNLATGLMENSIVKRKTYSEAMSAIKNAAQSDGHICIY